MRIKLALLTILLQILHLDAFAQKITIVEKNIPLGKVFNLVQKQSGLSLFYDSRLIRNDRRIDIDMREASVEKVMDHCLKDQPFTYVITDNIIVIKKKELQVTEDKALRMIRGVILGKDSLPLHGASVMLKEIKRAVQTDTAGHFIARPYSTGRIYIDDLLCWLRGLSQTDLSNGSIRQRKYKTGKTRGAPR